MDTVLAHKLAKHSVTSRITQVGWTKPSKPWNWITESLGLDRTQIKNHWHKVLSMLNQGTYQQATERRRKYSKSWAHKPNWTNLYTGEEHQQKCSLCSPVPMPMGRAVARDGKVVGVAINFADRRAWFWVWLSLDSFFLFLQPLPALALIVVHWNHFMWSKGTCARLYLAISDRYGYCEL